MAANRSQSSIPKIGNQELIEIPIPRNDKQLTPVHEIIFWEDNNPNCVINLVTDRMREYMRELPPSLLAMDEVKLRKQLEPGWTIESLRQAFWDEYFITVDNKQKAMRLAAVYAKVCTREHFYDIIKNQLALSYIVCPPAEYMYKMRSLLDIGLERIREVLSKPLENPNGTVNTRLISEIVKIVALVDNRVKGAVVQKVTIDQTSKNLNVNFNPNYEPPKSVTDIDNELANIDNELRMLKAKSTLPTLTELVDAGQDEQEMDVIEVKGVSSQKEKA